MGRKWCHSISNKGMLQINIHHEFYGVPMAKPLHMHAHKCMYISIMNEGLKWLINYMVSYKCWWYSCIVTVLASQYISIMNKGLKWLINSKVMKAGNKKCNMHEKLLHKISCWHSSIGVASLARPCSKPFTSHTEALASSDSSLPWLHQPIVH